MPRKPDPDARRKLLAAARAAFSEVGVDAARVEDIARAAGLSKGAFYLHFESKEAAFAQVVTDFFAVMGDLTAQRDEAYLELRGSIGTPCAEDWRTGSPRLRAWADCDHAHTVRGLQALWRHRDVLRCLLEQGSGPRRALLDQLVDWSREMLSAQLARAIRDGGLRSDVEADLVSELIIGMYMQLGRRMTRLASRPDFEAWALTVDSLLREDLAARPHPVTDRAVSQESA